MPKYTYKCVAGPANIGVKTERERAEAVKAFEAIINDWANKGWEYVGIDEYSTTMAPGCTGASKPSDTTVLKMLVFRMSDDQGG